MTFKYGDLVIKCHQCGNIEVVEEMVTDGRALYLFNTEGSWIKLHCPVCDITMEMSLQPNEKANAEYAEETNVIEKTNEELPKESITEETV
jgi:hypothetical protein